VISRSFTLLFRHFLTFFIVTLIAFSLPRLFAQDRQPPADPAQALITLGAAVLLMVLSMFSSAIILHGTFADMRNRPVNLLGRWVAFRRLPPPILLAFLVPASGARLPPAGCRA
jgi:hypothetical protein